MQNYINIAIAGVSGAGKSILSQLLTHKLGIDSCSIIAQDNFYKPKEQISVDKNGNHNFDLPESLDLEKFESFLQILNKGRSVEVPIYNYNKGPEKGFNIIEPRKYIICEGQFLFEHIIMDINFDYKIFIDAEEHIRLERRILRDVNQRNYPAEDVIYKFENHLNDAYQKYILPQMQYADYVIHNNHSGIEDFENSIDELVEIILKLYP